LCYFDIGKKRGFDTFLPAGVGHPKIKMKIQIFTKLAALTAFAVGLITTQAATLNIGDPAPKLQVASWAQGDPVTEFKTGIVYIVEFWATWCGPCRASIPHLNQTYLKFKDKGVVVIGVDVWEDDTSKVAPFIKEMGTNMTYRVALDQVVAGEKKGKMAETWMEASGSQGIPTAFLVGKDGKIVWIGHPMTLKDSVIEQVMAGTFDVKKAAEEKQKAEAKQTEIMKHAKNLDAAVKAKEWDKADAALTEIEKLVGEEAKGQVDATRLKILMGKGDSKGVSKLAASIADRFKDNPQAQNSIAWDLATDKGLKERDLDLAAKLAQRAVDLTKGEDPAFLDTQARIFFMQGKKDKAIEIETKALGVAKDDFKKIYQDSLDSYKADKLPEVK